MIIAQSKYKDTVAVELRGQTFTALVLPNDGGKIASFKDEEGEEFLLQNSSKNYLHIGIDDEYVDGECSGFDDMFPTIDAVKFIYQGIEYNYPDHGEIARISFEYEILSGERLVLKYISPMGYSYQKTLFEENGKLTINYEIVNFLETDINVLWAGHCLIKAVQGGVVDVPFEEGTPVDVIFDTSGVYSQGERIEFKKQLFFSLWRHKKPSCNKFYFPNKAEEGYLSYKYPNGKRFEMQFSKDVLKYVGIWQNFGYLKNYYCIGLEPGTVGYDTVLKAKAFGQSGVLKKHKMMKFFLKLAVIHE